MVDSGSTLVWAGNDVNIYGRELPPSLFLSNVAKCCPVPLFVLLFIHSLILPNVLYGLGQGQAIFSLIVIVIVIVSSDRSSYSDAVLLNTAVLLSQIFTQSIEAIDVTSVTLSRSNSINATEVTRC